MCTCSHTVCNHTACVPAGTAHLETGTAHLETAQVLNSALGPGSCFSLALAHLCPAYFQKCSVLSVWDQIDSIKKRMFGCLLRLSGSSPPLLNPLQKSQQILTENIKGSTAKEMENGTLNLS